MIWIVLTGWLLVSLAFAFLWRLSVRQTNAGWVDVGWSFTLAFLVVWYAGWVDGLILRRLIWAIVLTVWGLRLGLHILSRLRRESSEDGRYQFLRSHWGGQANRNFFFFFQGQGLANLLLTAPLILLLTSDRSLGWVDYLAWGWMLLSVAGERQADLQLARWKADPKNRGKTCRQGWWAYSRHPNYFFEWCFWLGLPLAGLGFLPDHLPAFLFTFLSPAVMLYLLLQVTGIPYTEKQSLKSRGEDYARYQREVSRFFPLPSRNTFK